MTMVDYGLIPLEIGGDAERGETEGRMWSRERRLVWEQRRKISNQLRKFSVREEEAEKKYRK